MVGYYARPSVELTYVWAALRLDLDARKCTDKSLCFAGCFLFTRFAFRVIHSGPTCTPSPRTAFSLTRKSYAYPRKPTEKPSLHCLRGSCPFLCMRAPRVWRIHISCTRVILSSNVALLGLGCIPMACSILCTWDLLPLCWGSVPVVL